MKKLILLMGLAVSMSFATRIGVLKPNTVSCDEEVSFDMDVEDSHNQTRVVTGSNPAVGISLGGHARFTFCVLDVPYLYPSKYDYAVLQLDKTCPGGGYSFGRRHDNEDKANANSHYGNISPNQIHENTLFYFCFVPNSSSTHWPVTPHLGNHGVFMNPTSTTGLAYSQVFIDDENSKNNNYWIWPEETTYYKKRISKIMNGDKDTYYNVVWWVGSSASSLAKTSDVNVPSVAESQISAASAAAASIKGFSRAAVNVELESAGNVEVSVMGINGAIVAKIVKENLQAGSHDIGWNLANVPNGRYIVAVKHNGKMSAKNVILK